MYFKIETSFIGKSHDLLENESNSLDEKRVNERVNDFTMLVSRMFIKYDLVLHEEVRHIIFKIDISGNGIQPDQLPKTINRESFKLRI